MAVRVAQVHLADVPGHVGGRPGDLQTLLQAMAVHGVDVVHPERHPHTPVGRFALRRVERDLHGAPATAALPTLTQEDLATAGAHAAEGRRAAPVPELGPTEPREPLETLPNIRHVEDRGHTMRQHDLSSLSAFA